MEAGERPRGEKKGRKKGRKKEKKRREGKRVEEGAGREKDRGREEGEVLKHSMYCGFIGNMYTILNSIW